MTVSQTMNTTYTKPADAKAKAKSSYQAGATTYTNRGTAIVDSNNSSLNKNSFLNILVAELSNMDPTKDQDSTAYVTQMAEFASIEQLNNLNTTMQDFAYEQMVGKVGILSDKDSSGNNKFGLIQQIIKNGTTTYAYIQDTTTGELSAYDIKKVIGTSDSGYTTANFETALNSSYMAASNLASSKASVVLKDSKSETSYQMQDDQNYKVTTTTYTAVEGVIKGAYIDKNTNSVKITVALIEDGKETGKTKNYNYGDIMIAGQLTEEQMAEMTDKINKMDPVKTTEKVTGVSTSTSDSSSNTGTTVSGTTDTSADSKIDSATESKEVTASKSKEVSSDLDKTLEKENEVLAKYL